MNKFRIGRHVGRGTNISYVPKFCKSLGIEIFQVMSSTKNYYDSVTCLKTLKSELEKYDIVIVIHTNYTVNFCNNVDSRKFKLSVNILVNDLLESDIIGNKCIGVVVHLGKNIKENGITKTEAINNYVSGIETCFEKTPHATNIIIETGAGQGTEIGFDLNDLALIYNQINEKYYDRLLFCIDTCHIWAAGYDISTKSAVINFFKLFDKIIGLDKIALIHYNDSKNEKGKRVDRHEDLTYGKIGLEGLKHFAKMAKKYGIPILTETPLYSTNAMNVDITIEDELALIKTFID
jgi:deoxyribonuclease IV